mmetsp:Transcript_19283/g.46569  ORF Transcript_19283/g.46569 Transcript_19283/m.46569 type:complete len:489 (+) Transcript_19283:340-1806(+)
MATAAAPTPASSSAAGGKVHWGANTTFTFNTPAPSASSATPGSATGAAAPGTAPPAVAGGGLFGASTTPAAGSLFGGAPVAGATTTPPATGGAAPASGFGFGNTPSAAPASTSSMFGGTGTATPTPSLFGGAGSTAGGSLFGTPSPAPSTGFGGGLFGGISGGGSSSLFGTPQQQQQQPQQPTIPAHAAMQAHHQASVQQEDQRVRSKLERIYREYTGTVVLAPGEESPSARFVCVVYNQLTPQQRQLQWLHSSSSSGITGSSSPSVTTLIDIPRPQQISDRDWKEALVNNPDPLNYVPQALVGAQALEARKVWQQDEAKKSARSAMDLVSFLDFVHQRHLLTKQRLEESVRVHKALRTRLVDVMKKVEIARCREAPLQADEVHVRQRLNTLMEQVEKSRQMTESLRSKLHAQLDDHRRILSITGSSSGHQPSHGQGTSFTPQMAQNLLEILKEQRQALSQMSESTKSDMKDVNLIGNRVVVASAAGK